MANERGRLPKAGRGVGGARGGGEVDERLQRMLGRWFDNAYRDDNLFLTMARRPGLLDATWGFIKYIYGGGSSIEPELFELVRVKLAWNNRCVHGSRARSSSAVSRGATEELVAKLAEYEASDLPERTKAALRL